MTECDFCARGTGIQARTFYDRGNWFAFLASPANLTGHAILAVKSLDGTCPQALSIDVLRGLDQALADVADLLHAHYQPKRVLFASLRAVDPHVHVHLFPVTEAHEAAWRQEKGAGYEKGRFFEFLGDQERTARQLLDAGATESVNFSTADVVALRARASTSRLIPSS